MPSWRRHKKVGKKDGFSPKIMYTITRRIDDLYEEIRRGELSGIPLEAEWMGLPHVINSLENIKNEQEKIECIKAVAHHCILEFLKKLYVLF